MSAKAGVNGAGWWGVLASSAYVLAIVFILPRLGAPMAVAVCAGGMTLQVWAFRDSFRSRTGSLLPAKLLLGFMWGCAAVVGAIAQWGGGVR